MKGTIIDFLQLVVDKPELAKELEELAARFEFEFTDEVSDEELENVAGGVTAVRGQTLSEPVATEQTKTVDVALTDGQTAAPYIPGGSVLSAAISGLGQLKNTTGG